MTLSGPVVAGEVWALSLDGIRYEYEAGTGGKALTLAGVASGLATATTPSIPSAFTVTDGGDGTLTPITGSTRPLSGSATAPAQVQFSPDGSTLVVTERATQPIDIYTLTQPEQAQELLVRKVANVRTTGATIVATANPGCHLQIARGLKESAVDVGVMHPVSLLARGYRRERG